MEWDWDDFRNEALRREFSKITDIGSAVLEEDDLNRVSSISFQRI